MSDSYQDASLQDPGNGDFFLNIWFYLNIVWYLTYCSFISTITFQQVDEPGYTVYRDLCIKGAYYELQYSTQTGNLGWALKFWAVILRENKITKIFEEALFIFSKMTLLNFI